MSPKTPMSSNFWEGIQGLTSVPSLLQGLGAAPIFSPTCLFFFFFSGFWGDYQQRATITMQFSQHLKRQQNTLDVKSPHQKDPVSGSWPGVAGLQTGLRDPSLQPKKFPCWTKEKQESISKQQQAEKKSAWGETSPVSAQQENVRWYFAFPAPVCWVVQQQPTACACFLGRAWEKGQDVKKKTNLRPSRESCLHWPWENVKGRIELRPRSSFPPLNPPTLPQNPDTKWSLLEQSPARRDGNSLYSIISGQITQLGHRYKS